MVSLKKRVKRNKLVKQSANKISIIREQINDFTWQKQEVKNFIVVCLGRSGSTCFLDLLSSHPQVSTNPHTFFNYNNQPMSFDRTKYVYSKINCLGFKFRSQPPENERNAQNIEIAQAKLNQLAAQGVTIFYLRRDNILKRAISKVIANRKARQHNYRQGQTVPELSLNLSPEEVLEALESCHQQTELDRQIMEQVPHILINYEADLEQQESHQETLNRCCEELKLTLVEARTKFVKIAPQKFSDYIVNWNEIRQSIIDSPYKQFLEM